MNRNTIDVLYVEDDAGDVDLAYTAIKNLPEHRRLFKMDVVEDGDLALKYLNRLAPYQNAKRPDMVLLDLNLPKIHGMDVLKTIRASQTLKNIPVVVLTTSRSQEDVDHSYETGASAFLTKPGEFAEYIGTFRSLYEFWVKRNHFRSKS